MYLHVEVEIDLQVMCLGPQLCLVQMGLLCLGLKLWLWLWLCSRLILRVVKTGDQFHHAELHIHQSVDNRHHQKLLPEIVI